MIVNYEPAVTLIWSIIKFSGFYILCIRKMKKEESTNEDQLMA
ncbi:hypothetical protein [Priestia megaterium]|nr:hypothetical protein [Priestia megaterium]